MKEEKWYPERGYNNRQVGFFITEELYRRLQKKVYDCGYERTLSSCMRALIKKWVEDKVSIDV